jgi:hypothetical protein
VGHPFGLCRLPRQVMPLLRVFVQIKELLVAGAAEPDILLVAVGDPVRRLAQGSVLAVQVAAPALSRSWPARPGPGKAAPFDTGDGQPGAMQQRRHHVAQLYDFVGGQAPDPAPAGPLSSIDAPTCKAGLGRGGGRPICRRSVKQT